MKLKQIPVILITGIAVVIALLSSCSKTQYYQITKEEEAEWVPYSQKDSIVFGQQSGDMDTCYIWDRIKGYTDGYHEFIECPIIKVRDTVGGENKYGKVYLYKESSGLSVKVQLPHYYQPEEITKLPMNIANVNGKNYSDVYIVAANPFYLDYENYIDTMYYSKKYGFLKYVDMNGVEWLLAH